VQSKLHHFFENAFRVIRLAFLIVGVVLLYDFLHQYYLERISSFHRWLGAFGRIAEWIPPYPAEIGVFVLIIVIYLYFIASKIWNRFAEETVRLPNGRLDS
jgi:uncharacterized protein YjeT (DUF2065 family)